MPQHSKEFSGIWSFDISNIIELFGKFKEFFLGLHLAEHGSSTWQPVSEQVCISASHDAGRNPSPRVGVALQAIRCHPGRRCAGGAARSPQQGNAAPGVGARSHLALFGGCVVTIPGQHPGGHQAAPQRRNQGTMRVVR
jgi:hypothetical protein